MTTLPAVDTKICHDCAAPFTRRDNQPDSSWKRTRYCPDCGPRRSRGGRGTPTHAPKPKPPFQQPTNLPTDWRTRARCRGEDPELFFPVGTSGPSLLQIAEAKTVCQACPVKWACLEEAVASGDGWAIRGGMTAAERHQMRQAAS